VAPRIVPDLCPPSSPSSPRRDRKEEEPSQPCGTDQRLEFPSSASSGSRHTPARSAASRPPASWRRGGRANPGSLRRPQVKLPRPHRQPFPCGAGEQERPDRLARRPGHASIPTHRWTARSRRADVGCVRVCLDRLERIEVLAQPKASEGAAEALPHRRPKDRTQEAVRPARQLLI
jgi:hypothetical protein